MKQVADQLRGVRVLVGIAVFAVVAALAIAGCGDSSDATGEGTTGSEGSGTTITKALLIKKSDAICAKTDDIQLKGLEAFEKEYPGAVRTPKGLEKLVLEVALPAVSTEIEELKTLPIPSDETAPVREIYKALEKALRAAEKNPASVATSLGPFRAPGEMAKFFGFKECANAL